MALGVQIAVWMVTPIYASIKAARTDGRARKAHLESPLNEAESQVLYCIAKSNAREVNLYLAAEAAQLPFSDTELLAIANRLCSRQILSIPAFSGAKVALTDAGRRRSESVVQKIDVMIAAELRVGDRVRHINTGQEKSWPTRQHTSARRSNSAIRSFANGTRKTAPG
ncbi:hypothetical protein [Cupriavidus sp. SS-3]|uniref:hypothetical protein n=1 Tax=Cupriavidus sp. SS-3 TaxID=3109596 RepID=UPI002DBB3E4D|nr:hypothetical protein [Cupriavidus sp. SS-3]MEC3768861.1 hypothetical protein [Cupriavidus sp. SS-3]